MEEITPKMDKQTTIPTIHPVLNKNLLVFSSKTQANHFHYFTDTKFITMNCSDPTNTTIYKTLDLTNIIRKTMRDVVQRQKSTQNPDYPRSYFARGQTRFTVRNISKVRFSTDERFMLIDIKNINPTPSTQFLIDRLTEKALNIKSMRLYDNTSFSQDENLPEILDKKLIAQKKDTGNTYSTHVPLLGVDNLYLNYVTQVVLQDDFDDELIMGILRPSDQVKTKFPHIGWKLYQFRFRRFFNEFGTDSGPKGLYLRLFKPLMTSRPNIQNIQIYEGGKIAVPWFKAQKMIEFVKDENSLAHKILVFHMPNINRNCSSRGKLLRVIKDIENLNEVSNKLKLRFKGC